MCHDHDPALSRFSSTGLKTTQLFLSVHNSSHNDGRLAFIFRESFHMFWESNKIIGCWINWLLDSVKYLPNHELVKPAFLVNSRSFMFKCTTLVECRSRVNMCIYNKYVILPYSNNIEHVQTYLWANNRGNGYPWHWIQEQ